MKPSSVLALASVLPALACSVTHETTPVQVQLDGDVAKSQASALSTAATAATSDDGVAVAESFARAADTAAALVPKAKRGGRARLLRSSTSCACDAASRTCTFAGCSIGNATLSGTVAWGDGKITCDSLSVDVAATGSLEGAKASVECSIAYGPGEVSGSLHTTGTATVDGTTYAWDATITAKDVTFASGAFTGGSIDAKAEVTMTSSSETQRLEGVATVALP